jgi:hypothetical protein
MVGHDMRRLMNLFEADAALEGSLDATALGKMLPDITDMARFVSAIAKLRRGDVNLTVQERGQLGSAFISLLRSDRDDTMKVVRRLMAVHASKPDAAA